MRFTDIVSDRGRFILSPVYQVVINAKFENLKTMVDTAKNYVPLLGGKQSCD